MKVVYLLAFFLPPLMLAQQPSTAWEYATMRMPYPSSETTDSVEATVEICYHTDDGCRSETVRAAEPIPSRPTRREAASAVASDAARRRTLAKALSQLGKQGWEVIGPLPTVQQGDSETLLLKRKGRG